MKKYSKKNSQKSKVSKKNIKKTKIQKGGNLTIDNIRIIKTLFADKQPIDSDTYKAYRKKLLIKYHPDTAVNKSDVNIKLINSFNDWINKHYENKTKELNDLTWNRAIEVATKALYGASNTASTRASHTAPYRTEVREPYRTRRPQVEIFTYPEYINIPLNEMTKDYILLQIPLEDFKIMFERIQYRINMDQSNQTYDRHKMRDPYKTSILNAYIAFSWYLYSEHTSEFIDKSPIPIKDQDEFNRCFIILKHLEEYKYLYQEIYRTRPPTLEDLYQDLMNEIKQLEVIERNLKEFKSLFEKYNKPNSINNTHFINYVLKDIPEIKLKPSNIGPTNNKKNRIKYDYIKMNNIKSYIDIFLKDDRFNLFVEKNNTKIDTIFKIISKRFKDIEEAKKKDIEEAKKQAEREVLSTYNMLNDNVTEARILTAKKEAEEKLRKTQTSYMRQASQYMGSWFTRSQSHNK